MGVLANWREARERRAMAGRYLAAVDAAVDQGAPAWLREIAPGADRERIAREWRWACRSVALIVAERDALDDRTAADASHAADEGADGRDPVWRARRRAYAEALAQRGGREAPLTRLARILVRVVREGAEGEAPDGAVVTAARQLGGVRIAANEALRSAFGAVSLPEDEAPSTMAARGAS